MQEKAFFWPFSILWKSRECRILYLLKAAINSVKKHRGEEELDAMSFLKVDQGKSGVGRDETGISLSLGERRFFRGREEKK